MAFPNSMVDRITPATTDEHLTLVRDKFGIDDAWPVTTEPFIQWVVEDQFVLGRPAWERVGVQMTRNVEPYEKMKIRLLNGGHQAMCYIGMLLGYRYAPEALADAQINWLLQTFMEEVTPLVPPVPGIDLEDYKRTLMERFANPAINDQLAHRHRGLGPHPQVRPAFNTRAVAPRRASQDGFLYRGRLVPLPDGNRRPGPGDTDQ